MEQWRSVLGYEGMYEVSDLGHVRSVDRLDSMGRRWRGKLLKPAGHYPAVNLSRGGRTGTRTIHTLMLEAFVGPRPPGLHCCHWDGEPWNCVLGNLRWDTRKANQADMVRHGHAGRGKRLRGEENPHATLRNADVRKIRDLGRKGLSPQRIADAIGAKRRNVHSILHGTAWAHLR